jgi:outer membrane protein
MRATADAPEKRGPFQMTRLTVAAICSVFVLSAPAFAQVAAPPSPPLRMAFVDLQRIAAESTEGKAASAKVQALTQRKSGELAEKTKSLQANEQKLQQGGAVLSADARAQAQKEVDRLTVEIDRFQQDANAEVQELQQQLQADFQEKLRPVLDGVVKELGIGLLFSAGDAGAIFIDPSLDITGDVIKRFDVAKPAATTTNKPAAPGAGAKPAPPAAAPATQKPTAPTPPTAPPATQKPAAPPATQKPAAPPAKP